MKAAFGPKLSYVAHIHNSQARAPYVDTHSSPQVFVSNPACDPDCSKRAPRNQSICSRRLYRVGYPMQQFNQALPHVRTGSHVSKSMILQRTETQPLAFAGWIKYVQDWLCRLATCNSTMAFKRSLTWITCPSISPGR